MDFDFIIVDDDKAVRRILAGIIEKNDLGEVIDEAADGEDAERKIVAQKPDIALIDFLIPGKDGVEVIRSLKERDLKTSFIMISQVEDKDMITNAYESGIEFYIHKPINVVETVNVISKVKEMVKLKTTFKMIRDTVITASSESGHKEKRQRLSSVEYFLGDLGILGESGSEDIKVIIENIDDIKHDNLYDIYNYVSKNYKQNGNKKSNDIKAIEMRIRRAANKALKNIASLGIENYDNEYFLRFSSVIFDFAEVRKEMDYLRGKRECGGKINIKKFLEGGAFLCQKK